MDNTEASTPATVAPIKPILRRSRRMFNFPQARLDSCRRRLFEPNTNFEDEFPPHSPEKRGMSRSPEFIPTCLVPNEDRIEATVAGASPPSPEASPSSSPRAFPQTSTPGASPPSSARVFPWETRSSSLVVNVGDEEEESDFDIVAYNQQSNAEDWLQIPLNNIKYFHSMVRCWRDFIDVNNVSLEMLNYTPEDVFLMNSFAKVTDILYLYDPNFKVDRTPDEINYCNFICTAARIRRIKLRRKRNLGGPLMLGLPMNCPHK